MKFKTCPAFKVADSAATDAGTFEAIVSVFGNVDSVGDVVMPGAFTESLAEWKTSGDPIPVLWSHRMDDPRFSIGTVLDAEELEPGDPRIPDWAGEWLKANGGLWVKGQLDTSPEATDVAVAARKLLKGRLVKQFSYAYDVVDAGWGTVGGVDAYELRKLHLFEVSPTQIGANNLTQLLGAKASALVAATPELHGNPGAVHKILNTMDSNDICEAMAVLGKTLAERGGKAFTPRTTTEGADNAPGGMVIANDEEPEGVKSEELAQRDSGKLIRLRSQLFNLEMECAT